MGAMIFFAIVGLVAFKLVTSFGDHFDSNPAQVDSHGSEALTKIEGYFPGVVDNSFLFFTIFVAIVVLVLAVLVRIHPIFIPLFIIGWIFIVFISGIVSNIYQEMAASPQLISEASQLTFTTTILTYLPLIIGVFGMLIMMVMYKLWKADTDY